MCRCKAPSTTPGITKVIQPGQPGLRARQPIEVGHVVFFVKDVQACECSMSTGFAASDRYPERGAFLPR